MFIAFKDYLWNDRFGVYGKQKQQKKKGKIQDMDEVEFVTKCFTTSKTEYCNSHSAWR
jgi:hypothetical protein